MGHVCVFVVSLARACGIVVPARLAPVVQGILHYLIAQSRIALISAWSLSLGIWQTSCVMAADAEAGESRPPLMVQQFDQLVFTYQRWVPVMEGVRRLESPERPSEADCRTYMEEVLAAEIRVIDQRTMLTDSQTKKLRLAGRGDIAQYIRRADDLRPKLTSQPLDQQQYAELMREVTSLWMSLRFGIYSENSLFRKTLRRTLLEEQRVRFRQLERERQEQLIESALLKCEQSNDEFSLAGEARRKLVNLLLDHGQVPQQAGLYGEQIVLLEANHLRDRIKPLLSDVEWGQFELHVGHAKRVEPILERSGLWSARRPNGNDEELDDVAKD